MKKNPKFGSSKINILTIQTLLKINVVYVELVLFVSQGTPPIFPSFLRNYALLIIQSPHITSVQYCGGCSVHWRLFSTSGITSVLWGISSVLWRLLSTVGDSFSTVEVVQYSGDNISTCAGITSVLWG